MSKTIILYHACCLDGAGAMWSAWKHFGDQAEYIGVGTESKNQTKILKKCCEADDVFMCDAMLSPDYIRNIALSGTIVHLLDHHITNIEAWQDFISQPNNKQVANKVKDFTDLNRSGAGITWDHFHGGSRPLIIDYIEDFDLWKWSLPKGNIIYSYLEQFNWKNEEEIISQFEKFKLMDLNDFVEEGKPLVTFRNQLIEKTLGRSLRAKISVVMDTAQSRMVYTYNVPIVNTNHFVSEIGNILAKDESFAVIWRMVPSGQIHFSLRSDTNGENVGKICQSLGIGGAGHIHSGSTRFENLQHMLENVEFLTND